MGYNPNQPRNAEGEWSDGGSAIRAAASDKKSEYINPIDGSNKHFDYSHQGYRYKILSANLSVKQGSIPFRIDDGSGSLFKMGIGKITRPEPTKLKFSFNGEAHILNDNWDSVEPFLVKHKIILP